MFFIYIIQYINIHFNRIYLFFCVIFIFKVIPRGKRKKWRIRNIPLFVDIVIFNEIFSDKKFKKFRPCLRWIVCSNNVTELKIFVYQKMFFVGI